MRSNAQSMPQTGEEILLSARKYQELRLPVSRTVGYRYETADDIIATFRGEQRGFVYSRQGNPTWYAVEEQVTRLEDGVGSILFSSGMAAISSVFFTLLKAGDCVVASKFIFGSTKSLLLSFEKFGVGVKFIDFSSESEMAAALDESVTMVFVESISNPLTYIPDFDLIKRAANRFGFLIVVDNTNPSGQGFKPKQIGAGIVVNSLSKIFGGFGAVLGGAVTDTGLYDWKSCGAIDAKYKSKPNPLLTHIQKKGLRDIGACLSPESADILSLGAESLELRVRHIADCASAVAASLESNEHIDRVYYPSLTTHPHHDRAVELFTYFGGIISFTLRNIDDTKFLDALQKIKISSHFNDSRTLALPVAKTIFAEYTDQELALMGIDHSLIRLSIGLNAKQEIIEDIQQALEKCSQ